LTEFELFENKNPLIQYLYYFIYTRMKLSA